MTNVRVGGGGIVRPGQPVAVQSVTGDVVDNTDPLNPVINAAPLNTRTRTVASTATLTPNVSLYDMDVITAQAEALTISNPAGTPSEGNGYVVRVTDNGTARAISFGNKYRAFGSGLPTTTQINKTMYIVFVRNEVDDKYDVLNYIEEN